MDYTPSSRGLIVNTLGTFRNPRSFRRFVPISMSRCSSEADPGNFRRKDASHLTYTYASRILVLGRGAVEMWFNLPVMAVCRCA